MNLYLIKTKGLGDYYVVDKTTNDAIYKLKSLLDRAEYGFFNHRKVASIDILTSEIDEFPAGTPNFSSDNTLILPNTCDVKKERKQVECPD